MGMGESVTSADSLDGDRIETDHAFLQMYEELRRIARARLREQPVELIDHARAKGRLKRNGNQMRRQEITDIASLTVESDSDAILALEQSLCRLEKIDPSAAEVITLRFFTGLSIAETAEVTGMSGTTVNRRWKFARAWLFKEMGLNCHGRLRINSQRPAGWTEPSAERAGN
jgi:DNA invertase Pin-like site-specific DNA recombinase